MSQILTFDGESDHHKDSAIFGYVIFSWISRVFLKDVLRRGKMDILRREAFRYTMYKAV